ncbi:hypothetical protein KCU73_g12081, partial [Aureobasidium melanogenum]
SSRSAREQAAAEQGLLYPDQNGDASDDDESGLDLPPSARRSPLKDSFPTVSGENTPYADDRAIEAGQAESSQLTARGAFSQLMNATTEDAGTLFSRIDEGFIKPHLLLDPGGTRSPRLHGGA